VIFWSFYHHAVGTLDLAVAPRVGDRRVDINHVVLEKVLEGRSYEAQPEVSDDSVGHTEAMRYFFDKLSRFV
jgi:hypothetical protein